MTARFPARDQVAIAGVGTTPFTRDSGRTDLSLIVEAAQKAMADAGVTRDDIDGVVGTMVPAHLVQGALGIPEITYFNNAFPTFPQQVIAAMNAVFSGASETVLVYHSVGVSPFQSKAAAADPFRVRKAMENGGGRPVSPWPDDIHFPPSYASWANRYFHQYEAKREYLGYIAINSRTGATFNEHAPLRTPITMEDYFAARMVRGPLFGMLDMDFPVDGADAFIITTVERARDLQRRPVLIHSAALGQTKDTVEENMPDLESSAHQVTMRALWGRSELSLADVGLFLPYDGFSFICLKWFENVGYCRPGEAGGFLEDHWDKEQNRILINGKVPVNTHGGNLSDGATQGSGHTREAVLQLQGAADGRQVPNLTAALVPAGGFFMYTGALLLRTE